MPITNAEGQDRIIVLVNALAQTKLFESNSVTCLTKCAQGDANDTTVSNCLPSYANEKTITPSFKLLEIVCKQNANGQTVSNCLPVYE